jgi:hypothetical protein
LRSCPRALLDVTKYVPVTWDRSTGEVRAWDVHGGLTKEGQSVAQALRRRGEEFAALMPPFFVREDGSPILFPRRR